MLDTSKMIEIVDPADTQAVRNKDNMIACYETILKDPDEGAKFVVPEYIQHNSIMETGRAGLAKLFKQLTENPDATVEIHKVIASGDYVWFFNRFVNLFSDDPNDPGIGVVDIFRMNDEGLAVEHWDVLQIAPTPTNAAPWLRPNIPVGNQNGMF